MFVVGATGGTTTSVDAVDAFPPVLRLVVFVRDFVRLVVFVRDFVRFVVVRFVVARFFLFLSDRSSL